MRHHLLIGEEAHNVWLSRTAGQERLLLDDDWHVLAPMPQDSVVVAQGDTIYIHYDGRAHVVQYQNAIDRLAESGGGGGEDIARAPMPGSVIAVSVVAGDSVAAGDAMLVIESMKMETVIRAARDGRVETVHVNMGDSFERDTALVALAKED